jgi:hypothetical protein
MGKFSLRGRKASRVALVFAVLAAAAIASVFAVTARGTSLSINIDGTAAGAADAVQFNGLTYADAQSAVAAKDSNGTLTFPFSFQGLHALHVSNAAIDTDDADTTIAFTGEVTLPAFNGGETPGADTTFPFLITAQWPDATSTSPSLSLVVKSANVPLTSLNSLWGSGAYGGVSFSNVLLALSNRDTTLDPGHLPSTATTFFDSEGALDVKSGVSLRGTVDTSGRLADALGYAGWSGSIDLEGSLGGSPEVLFGDAGESDLASLDLKATLGKSATAPAWLTDRATTFEFSLDGSHTAKLGAHDDVTVSVDGKTNEFKGDVSIASTGAIEASLANVGTLDLPFGLANLSTQVSDVNLGLGYDAGTLTGTLGFGVTLPGHTSPVTVDAALKVTGNSAAADLSIDGSLDVQDLATFAAETLNATLVTIPAANQFTLDHIAFSFEHGVGRDIFSVGATATIHGLLANAVFTLRKEGAEVKPLLGLKLSDPNCGNGLICLANIFPSGQVGDLVSSLRVPAVTLIATPTSFTSLDRADLTTPELNFFSNVYDTVPDTVEFSGGLDLRTKFDVADLPASVRQAFGWSTGSVELAGSLGGSADLSSVDDSTANFAGLSLTATLPAATGGTVLPSWVSFTEPTKLGFSYAAGKVKATFSTGAHVDLGGGFDTTVEASFATSAAGSKVGFSAAIKDWQHPFNIQWLDITTAELAVDAEFGGGASPKVTAGLSSDISVGGKPFSLLAKLDVGDATKATITASFNGSTSLADLVGVFPGDLSNVSSSLNTALNAITVGPASVTVVAGGVNSAFELSATAHFTTNNHSIGATMFVSAKSGGKFTLGIKPDTSDVSSLSDLIPNAPDVPIELPSSALVLTNQTATLTKAQLTDGEFDFYKSLFGCADDATRAQCSAFENLKVTSGLKLIAGMKLPETVQETAAGIGIQSGGNVLVEGQIPVFGGNTFALTVDLGNFRFDKQPDWFDHGNVSLTISNQGLSFTGDLALRIRRAGDTYNATNCPQGTVKPIVFNDESRGSACYDTLDFALTAGIDYSDPAEPGITLSGALLTNGGWHHAFGQPWLTINHAALELGVKLTATGPEVTMGFQGDVVIGTKDVQAAIKVGLATIEAPPFVRPDLIGFSAASASGLALSDLVTLQEQVAVAAGSQATLNTDNLPDVSLRNFFFEFSQENDPVLCLTQGLHFNADLYVGTNLSSPVGPELDATGCRVFNTDPNAPSQSCILHKGDGCLASVGASVDSTGIRAKGELSGFDLGPISMKDSSFHLTLTATDQSLAMSGGVRIGSPSYTFADGSASLAFGRTGFFFTGDAAILNGAFHGYIQTSAPFDFSNPNFQLKVWLRADADAAINQAISTAIQGVKPVIVGLGTLWQLFLTPGGLTALQNLPTTLANAGISVPPPVQTVINGIAQAAATINQYGHGGSLSSLDFLLKGFKLPDFPGARSTFVPAQPTCLFVMEGGQCWTTPPWHTAFGDCCGVPGTIVQPTCLGILNSSGCWVIPPITGPSIPGMCAAVGIDPNSADCSWIGLLNRFVLTPLITKFNQVTGLNLPTNTTDIGNSITKLVNSLTAPNVSIFSLDCAEFQASATSLAGGNVNVSLAANMHVLGQPLKFGLGWDFSNQNGNAGNWVKTIFQQLLNPHPTECEPIPAGHETTQLPAQRLTETLTGATIDEGGTVTFHGTFADDAASYPAVVVDWSDGTTTTVPAGTSKTISASHVYPNDGPAGDPTAEYPVSATVQDQGSDTETANATVNNIAPSISSANVGTVSENDVATVAGSFTDPGTLDHHTLTVDWGDGSAPASVELALGARTFSASHRYLDNPAGGASYPVKATVSDDDTGTDDVTTQATVRNVAPSAIAVDPADVIADTRGGTGTVVREGAFVSYTVSFADPGTLDTHDVSIDWGDGSDPTEVDNVDAGVLTATVVHQFADNGSYDVKATVTDKDGASATGTTPTTVLNVAPHVEFGLDKQRVSEPSTVTMQATIDDPGTLDSQSVTIDWGDGTTPDHLELPNDQRAFQLQHTYLDDNPSGTPSDVNDIKVTSTDKDGGVGSETHPITVDDVAPSVDVTYSTLHLDEGQSVSVHGTITDPGVQDAQTVVVDWGDGTTPTTIDRTAAQREFDATHTYVDDNPTATPSDHYTIKTTTTDDDTESGSTSQEITVDNVKPVLANLDAEKDVNEGSAVHLSGDIVDPGLADTQTVSIDWGDGTTPTTIDRTATQRSFSSSHVYVDDDPTATPEDPYTITLVVTDDDTGKSTSTVPLTVHNVDPTVAFTLDKQSLNESETLAIDGTITDPGVRDSQTVVVSWGDGTAPDKLERTADQRTFHLAHTYLDDNPTATPVDVNKVRVTVTDDDTGVGTEVHDVTVRNVAPTLAVSLDKTRVDENNVVMLSGTITDPGVQDTNTVLIDWGPGRTHADQFQTLELPAAQRTFTVAKAYGDNGTFPIHVTVTDDDTGVGAADTQLVVDNLDPTAAIESTGAVFPQGVRTFITRAGVSTEFKARTTDRGSDDLLATWTWQDGSTTQTMWFAAPPSADPHPSPQVDARDLVDDHFHTWANACLYSNVGFDTRDDDGGTAADDAMVVVTGVDSRQRGSGYWKNQYAGRVGQSLAGTTLGCYLQIASFMSAVFPEVRPVATAADATDILASTGPDEHDKLDRELLTTWLDFANGALPYASFVNQVTVAERVRANPAASQADLRDQRQILQRLNND